MNGAQAFGTLGWPEFQGFALVCPRVFFFFLALPGLGEKVVPARVRLLLSIGIGGATAPCFQSLPILTIASFVQSSVIGLGLGLMVKFFFEGVLLAGGLVGQQLSLGAVQGSLGDGEEAFSAFLRLIFLSLIFIGDGHILLIQLLEKSFMLDGAWYAGDLMKAALGCLKDGSYAALSFASAFIVANMLFMLLLGVINRIIPAFPVFFALRALDLILALLVLLFGLSSLIHGFLGRMGTSLQGLF